MSFLLKKSSAVLYQNLIPARQKSPLGCLQIFQSSFPTYLAHLVKNEHLKLENTCSSFGSIE